MLSGVGYITFEIFFTTLRAVFKWLSKVITWLRLLRLVIGLKVSRQFLNQWETKPKPIALCTRDFSRALSELQAIPRNCDWFITLFAPVVIGRSNWFGFGFSIVIWKPLYQLVRYQIFLFHFSADAAPQFFSETNPFVRNRNETCVWFWSLTLVIFFLVFFFSNYSWLMLAAVRALFEQQPVEEDYSKFRWNIFYHKLYYNSDRHGCPSSSYHPIVSRLCSWSPPVIEPSLSESTLFRQGSPGSHWLVSKGARKLRLHDII